MQDSKIIVDLKTLRARAFPSFIRWATIVIAADQVGQAGSAFPSAWLGLIPWVYCRCCVIALNNLIRELPWHQGQLERPVVSQIFLPALLDGHQVGYPPVI